MMRLLFYMLGCQLMFMMGCASKSEVKTLKLAHGLDTKHPVHKGLEYMAQEIEKRSGGKLAVDLYPNGQLGNERELLELLQIGSLTLTKVSAAVMENFAPDYQVFGLPYLFASRDHQFRVLDGQIGEGLLNSGIKYRLKGLAFYDSGSRSFYTTEKKVDGPVDLEGLKIRVMKSNSAVEMVNTLGGSPTPISFGELYSALQQGVVDGAENNPPSFYSSRHYEICKYYTLDEHTSVPDVLLISTIWWDDLSEEEKGWVSDAAKASVTYQRELWATSEKEALEAVRKAGVEVIYPDKKQFQTKVDKLYDRLSAESTVGKLVKQIKQMQ